MDEHDSPFVCESLQLTRKLWRRMKTYLYLTEAIKLWDYTGHVVVDRGDQVEKRNIGRVFSKIIDVLVLCSLEITGVNSSGAKKKFCLSSVVALLSTWRYASIR